MSTQLTAPQSIQWDDEALINTIKETVCKGATPAQFRMFLEVCKATGLNPFLKEIWFVPGVGVIAGRDAYLRKANENPMFDGMETRVERNDNNVPIKAVCSVWRKDRAHPITCEAFFNEYKKGGNVWSTYPSAMIAKVAEVLALKRSFSINGVVTEEEIGTQEERGSKEEQQDVAQRRIKELSSTQPINTTGATFIDGKIQPAVYVELADSLDQAPEPPLMAYEERTTAKKKEAAEALKVEKPARAKGDISFKALKEIGTLKTVIRGITGNDDKYYELLGVFGVKHADELSLADGRKFYKALLAIPNALKQDEALLLEVQTHALRIGPYATQAVLERRGLKSVEEVLQVPNGDDLDALMKELRETV